MARDYAAGFFVEEASATLVPRFAIHHQAGRPQWAEVAFTLDTYEELDAMIGKPAQLVFGAEGDTPEVFVGRIEAATVIGTTAAGAGERGGSYVVRVVSEMGLLSRVVGSQIFQDLSVQEIVTEFLAQCGVTNVEWRLNETYEKREYCVQYQESALDFIMRLCEHEGIYSFIEVENGVETVVFSDDSTTAAPIDGEPALPVRSRSHMGEVEDAVYGVSEKRRVRSGKFVLRDFDFKRPALDMTVEKEADERAALEVYDYPGGYFEPSEGERLVKVRLEEAQVERHTLRIEAACPRIKVGRTLDLTDAGDLDGTYFVFEVTHEYVKGGKKTAPRYETRARLLPQDIPFRPFRTTPIPVIHGPQTAVVVAPESSKSETIHTDEHGRCKVKFHWDRSDVHDDKASCWMRVSQLQTSGSMMLPRIDWEVIVEFLEGNPDRPLVTGKLYNGVQMPPYALPDGKTRTAIKTASTPGGGGSNEIRFEDKAGSEEIMIHAQYDMKVVAANNATTKIGNNETTVVTNNASLAVGSDQTTKVTKGASNTIGADQTVQVDGNRKVEVNAVSALTAHGNSSTSVGGNQFEMDGNPLAALLALAAEAAANFATSMANNAVATVQAHVDGAVAQAMAPITNLQSQVQGVQNSMQAVANGDLSGVAGMVAGASGLPGATDLAGAMVPPPTNGPPPAGPPGGNLTAPVTGATNAVAAMASNAASQAIHAGVGAGANALASALGIDGGGGGGESMANAAGPAGDVAGIDETDRTKGPGHAISKIAGSQTEKVGSMRALASIQSIDTNVTGDSTIDVGAATLQLAVGNYAETVGGAKTEKSVGLIVLSKGGESETISGSKTTMVGGAIVDKLKGSHSVTAGGPATFVGAFHKIEAGTAIVFKCGASEVVIDGSGVTVTSPLVAFLGPKLQLPKKVAEV